VRRRGPRHLSAALEGIARDSAPATLLARVQGCWNEAVGPSIAAEAQPLSERGGTLTVVCRSATWASELELLAPDLVAKLNRALGDTGGSDLTTLRTRVGKLP
jgi:predicted nucleic acid-binding Zn ribbon protein